MTEKIEALNWRRMPEDQNVLVLHQGNDPVTVRISPNNTQEDPIMAKLMSNKPLRYTISLQNSPLMNVFAWADTEQEAADRIAKTLLENFAIDEDEAAQVRILPERAE